ncbi:uncharacterized protein LOC107484579 [Arachis duranensis]|uniref:Uncharacterized protein LOC107484579 n=1 Tax=Arachis duranensis TaxID=130453 RepID=A0A6P4D437_ARADU|nr:uncharacterized protein LOC107484579 [Arachis duranensis]
MFQFCEYGLSNSKMDLPNCDNQLDVAVRKTSLRDLQSDDKMKKLTFVSSSLLKDKDVGPDSNNVFGSKRLLPHFSVNHLIQQSIGNNAANGHLLYARRKSEVELGKSIACENPSINDYCRYLSQLCCEQETAQIKPLIKVPKVSCFPTFAHFPMTSSMSSSRKPSVPISLRKSPLRLSPVESNYMIASSGPASGNPKGLKSVHWEEQYQQLQMFLRKLDHSDQEEYILILRSLSFVELSRHAIELEKRSIQLSLEEGMCETEPYLDDGSTSELSGQWTDGWSTNSSDEDDSNGSEEPHSHEGDSGPADSEFQGCDGGGCDVDASIEDHENSRNIIGEQFSSPDLVNGSALLSTEFTGVEYAYTRYAAYAKDIGFSVEKGDSVKDEVGNIVRKFFYYNWQGLREK